MEAKEAARQRDLAERERYRQELVVVSSDYELDKIKAKREKRRKQKEYANACHAMNPPWHSAHRFITLSLC